MAKKIINGKKYDTSTAICVGAWESGYDTGDFSYCSEELYLKKTGEFFLFGEGGGLSCYASHCGNSSGWGNRIIPLSKSEALEWASEHLDGETVEEYFGEIPE